MKNFLLSLAAANLKAIVEILTGWNPNKESTPEKY